MKRDIADTRRKILSLIASLFDPIGFLAPFLVRAKLLFQQVWQFGIGWDETPPSEFLLEWSKWQKELNSLSEFLVPRFYRHVSDSPTVIQLHVFGDASEQAFCSVAYFGFSYPNGSVKCAFVTAKTRVAPKKPLSIPKLELQAAVLSARLSTVVIKEHDYRIDSTYLWTDSSSGFVVNLSDTPPSLRTELGRFWKQLNQANGIIALVLLTQETMVAEDFQSQLSHQRVDG